MLRMLQKTLFVGLGGILGIGIGIANASNVLHEMVPHVVLPETIQYDKTAKNAPGTGYTGASSPYVATYVAFPSYQVAHTTAFRPVGQSVYPVTPPPPLPAPLPKEQPEPNTATEKFVLKETDGEDIVLSTKMTEPIRLAANSEYVVPPLPQPSGAILQTHGLLCQKPASPPSAWAFSSPVFKVASVPAGWGGQAGGIVHSSPKGSSQLVGFQPGNGDPTAAGAMPPGIPYSTFQTGAMGQQAGQECGPQVQVLPNGMILLTLPQSHHNCGLIRCKTGNAPRSVLLPPAGFAPLQVPTPQVPVSQGMVLPEMMPLPQMAMMTNGFAAPYMQVAQQSQMMPQMPPVPIMTMTPMGPAIVGYQQMPQMQMPMQQMPMQQMPMPQMQMAVAMPNPLVASQAAYGEDAPQQPAVIGSSEESTAGSMALVATPYGYAIKVPSDLLQTDAAAQLAQMQQSLIQSQVPMQMPISMNPYTGLYATPFGYIAMNQAAGQFGAGQAGQMMTMPVGYSSMGMPMQGGGMSISEMLQILTFINSNKPQQRRPRMADRLAERREARKEATAQNDPFTQLTQAWSTPYVAPDTTLRMPARNAYPYGYFGVQASPMGTANYGGYHNLYFGNTSYPGLY